MGYKVYYFHTSHGNYPVKDFVEKQNLKTQAKIGNSIHLLINHGPMLKPPYVKKIKGKLYELRIVGSTSIRIFYIFYNSAFYLLHGLVKKSQKTPHHDIKTALDRMRELV